MGNMGLNMRAASGFCYSLHNWDVHSKGERMSDIHLVKVHIEPWLEWATRNPAVKESEQVLKSSNNPLLGVWAQETQHIKQEFIPEVTEVCSKKEKLYSWTELPC